jgi:hypothetical protein
MLQIPIRIALAKAHFQPAQGPQGGGDRIKGGDMAVSERFSCPSVIVHDLSNLCKSSVNTCDLCRR